MQIQNPCHLFIRGKQLLLIFPLSCDVSDDPIAAIPICFPLTRSRAITRSSFAFFAVKPFGFFQSPLLAIPAILAISILIRVHLRESAVSASCFSPCLRVSMVKEFCFPMSVILQQFRFGLPGYLCTKHHAQFRRSMRLALVKFYLQCHTNTS
ncbi:MAG TPA: hypothetical protein VFB79_14735 [Candidatus Angelobacter sp.]|nr:hypothetical protein [Candidatus Angelobacter sp.]